MSIWATWLTIEHPDDWIAGLAENGIDAGVIGDDSEERELGSPWIYQGSHVLPADSDPRGGGVSVAAVPNHITRDGRDDGGEGLHDWLRLEAEGGVDGDPVILNRPQVEALRNTLTAWLDRSGEVE